jgi:hypothetical protein
VSVYTVPALLAAPHVTGGVLRGGQRAASPIRHTAVAWRLMDASKPLSLLAPLDASMVA